MTAAKHGCDYFKHRVGLADDNFFDIICEKFYLFVQFFYPPFYRRLNFFSKQLFVLKKFVFGGKIRNIIFCKSKNVFWFTQQQEYICTIQLMKHVKL